MYASVNVFICVHLCMNEAPDRKYVPNSQTLHVCVHICSVRTDKHMRACIPQIVYGKKGEDNETHKHQNLKATTEAEPLRHEELCKARHRHTHISNQPTNARMRIAVPVRLWRRLARRCQPALALAQPKLL